MRARVALKVKGFYLPPPMDKRRKSDCNKNENELIDKHFLFNDMTTDNHLTSSGVASDWPFGRGIWISQDETKMIWVGEEDQLRIISIVQGMILEKLINHSMNYLQELKRVDYNLPNIQCMELLPNVQLTWELARGNQFYENSLTSLNKNLCEKIERFSKNFRIQGQKCCWRTFKYRQGRDNRYLPSARFGVMTMILWEDLYKFYDLEKQAGKGGDRQNCCTIKDNSFEFQSFTQQKKYTQSISI